MCAQEILAVETLQRANTAFIQLDMPYEERKEQLLRLYAKQFPDFPSPEALSKELATNHDTVTH